MDNRAALRVEVNGQIGGKIVLVQSLEIKDISLTGIRFNCAKRVEMNCPYRIKIEKNNISVNLRGTIIRASLIRLPQVDEDGLPVYEVAMHFEKMSEEDKKALEQLISIFHHE